MHRKYPRRIGSTVGRTARGCNSEDNTHAHVRYARCAGAHVLWGWAVDIWVGGVVFMFALMNGLAGAKGEGEED